MSLLNIWLESFDRPIGHLVSRDDGAIAFGYDPAYLAASTAHPISMSLPLREQGFDDVATRAFFQNLLPENNQLDQVIEREGLDRGDIVGILAHVGADLSGALSCLRPDAPPIKVPGRFDRDYSLLDTGQLQDIVRRLGSQMPLPAEIRDPSPVAGYQRKVALLALDDGRFAVPNPNSGAPTTHILKVPDTSLPREAFYEAWSGDLARALGLDVAPSRSLWIGDYEALLATRFDRVVQGGSVYRLHQEDFAQALGLPPRLKYQREGRPGRAFDAATVAALLRRTANPAAAIDAFLRTTIFNLAIGNTDNHAKNNALLYDVGATPRLAPLYDLVPIRLSDTHRHDLSFAIGAATLPDLVTTRDLIVLLEQFGLRGGGAARFTRDVLVPMLAALARDIPTEDQWRASFIRLFGDQSRNLLDLLAPIAQGTATKG